MNIKLPKGKVLVKTGYMDEPILGYIRRVRIEVETEIGITTLVDVARIKEITELEDKK